ncbi:HNH endonuclease [Leuconostoc falkenbergense]|uniref:HNH endonuclease n=1 Tax=Leuconostoc falkenbergense TaxID=2766470 RepID=UPI0039ED0053
MRIRKCHHFDCPYPAIVPNWFCDKHLGEQPAFLAKREKYEHKHSKTQTHVYNTVTRYRNETKRDQYNFYRTKQWVDLRKIVLERDHYLCQYCLLNGKYTSAKTVDHIIPIEYDSSMKADTNNLATICTQCHHIKTELEQEQLGTGQDNKLIQNKIDINLINNLNYWSNQIQIKLDQKNQNKHE